MIDRHLARINARHPLSNEEVAAIRALFTASQGVGAHQTFIEAGARLDHSILILDGIAARYKDLRDGQRQITALHVPGDFADLHSFTLKRLDHSLMALTRCRIAPVPHARIADLIERFPRIGRIYWFSTNLDASIHREWVLSMGARNALARIAHLFCELQVRLDIVGLGDARGYALDLSQTDLAECHGLTPVHVNRSLRRLREMGVLTFRSGRVEITDPAALRAIAEFDPDYLYLNPDPL
ncbi:Crp/Fnr family transcriptional regulator [Sphingomonas sp.]|jgi:CRP-like cAMP-binding protein|uniref:Crp/Fnr family transcriptional regulator n=1 Tax=Sphingomonas sp. TaxID=28214 RepID=UPI002E14755F|nr:Crp/Fnr family transcriptional regulator [Sphingomonas sp.]